MAREICIHPNDPGILRDELRFVVAYFQKLGQTQCELVFGWHWGLHYPPGNPWGTNLTLLSEVDAAVRAPELAGLGQFGQDDVQILIPPLNVEVLFCHHGGIHFKFVSADQVALDFFQRWSDAEFGPIECDIVENPSDH